MFSLVEHIQKMNNFKSPKNQDKFKMSKKQPLYNNIKNVCVIKHICIVLLNILFKIIDKYVLCDRTYQKRKIE